MRTAIYLRQSQDKTGNWAAIERQELACTKLAEAKGLEDLTVYKDNDRSASNGKERPEFNRLVTDMEAGKVHTLIVWHLDRLTRNVRDLTRVIEAGKDHRTNIASVHGVSLDLGDPTGVAVATILTAIAAMEVQHKGARQRSANEQRARRGETFWTRRPFGYQRHNGEVTIVEDEAAAIREGARMVLAGSTITAVARHWNSLGLTTTAGNPWGVTQVRRLLINPRYIGRRIYNGEDLGDGSWPAILDPEQLTVLEAKLTDPRRKTAPNDLSIKYLLSGIAACGKCGKPMYASPSPTKNGPSRMIYRCMGGYCLSRGLEQVDAVVEAAVIGVLARPDAAALFNPDSNVTELRAKAAALRERRDTLAALLGEGLLSPGAVREQSGKLTTELRDYEAKIDAADTLDPLGAVLGTDDIQTGWLALPVIAKRQIIEALMKVRILPMGKGHSFTADTVEIMWKGTP